MWKTIIKLTNQQSKTTLISEIWNDNQNLTKKHEIADLNSHFNEISSRLVNNMPQSSRTPESYVTRPDTQFTIQNVSLKVGYSRICACAGLLFKWGHRKLSSSVCARSSLIFGNNTRVVFTASEFNSPTSEEVSKIF